MLRIQALGGLAVFDGERPLAGAAKQPKRLALMAMLARAGSRGVSRDRLLLMLWPDADEERARRGLNQALYALRQDLGEAAIAGSADLRLDPALVTSDVQEFADARAAGRLEAAAAIWKGPFLDGFGLPGLPEFERWAEGERDALSHDYRELLETLAAQASGRGDAVAAVGWWRKLAALDPHNGRVAESLMRALVAAGDVPGALRHADIFNTLLDADLGLPPDRQITSLAERIRAEAAERPALPVRTTPATPVPPPAPEPVPVLPLAPTDVESSAASVTITSGWATVTLPPAAPRESTPPAGEPRPSTTITASGDIVEEVSAAPRRRGPLVLAGLLALLLAGVLYARGRTPATPPAAARTGAVVAVGRIADYTRSPTGDRSAPLSDMLATNLARAEGLEVVSTSRMYELLAQLRREGDSSDGAVARAARLAGATHLVDGALYEVSAGRLRLDLRRVDLASGSVKSAHTVEGTDLFVLADSGTRRIAAGAGGTAASGSLASVTTTSEVAYRFYDAGLRAFVRGERGVAAELFRSALKEDSSFAMAAYYLSRSSDELAEMLDAMERARRLSAGATPRERLTIRAAWGFLQSEPSFRAAAESLATEYPNDLDGAYWYGQALIREREYAAAVPVLRRAVQMDSVSLRGNDVKCVACEAWASLVFAYVAADSLPAAERELRRWTAVQPDAARPYDQLADVLRLAGRTSEAEAALATAVANGLSARDAWMRAATIAYHAEDFARADSILEPRSRQGSPAERWDAAVELMLVQRAQGRFEAAIRTARAGRQAFEGRSSERLGTRGVLLGLAEALSDAGRYPEALAVLDSASRLADVRESPASYSRQLAFNLLEQSVVRWRTGDTVALDVLADSLRRLGEREGQPRTLVLSGFPRGLAALERGRAEEAVALLRGVPTSPVTGLGMLVIALGEAQLAAGRPRDAVATLQPLLRSYETGPYLITDYHEALARAWDAAGRRDSARVHWRAVVRAWGRADSVVTARLERARLGSR